MAHNNNDGIITDPHFLDGTDFKIISMIILDYDNKEISSTLKTPLSTIQRRTRRILQSGIVKVEYIPDYKMLGIKKGLLHTYLRDGQLKKTAEKISKMEGILSTSIHVGSSDVVSEFVYYNSKELIKIIEEIKKIDGVEKVEWSEEILRVETKKDNIMKSFKKYWNNSNDNNTKPKRYRE